jgi:cell division protein FtsB
MELTVRIRQGWVYSMRRVLATLCVALLTVFLGYKVVFGANGMKVWQAKRAEARQLQQEIDRMKAEQRELQRLVDGLQRGDPNMIEKEAREQLGYVKPGEVVLFEHKAKTDLKTPAVAANTDQR